MYTWATKPGTTMVFTLVPVIEKTMDDVRASRSAGVTRRPYGTAMQRGTNMNWVAMTRTVTPPSAPTVVPKFCSANSPDRCSVLGSIRSTLLGGFMSPGQRREHDHAENRGDEHSDAERPQQFGAENSPLVRFGRLLGHGLPHRAAREEDEQVNRQIAEHQQGDGGPGQDAGSERHDAHDLGERGFIDFVGDLGRNVSGGEFVARDHRLAPRQLIFCNLVLYKAIVGKANRHVDALRTSICCPIACAVLCNTRPLVAPRYTAASCHSTKSLRDSGGCGLVLRVSPEKRLLVASEAPCLRIGPSLTSSNMVRQWCATHDRYMMIRSSRRKSDYIISKKLQIGKCDHMREHDNYLDEEIKTVSSQRDFRSP